MRNPYLLGIFGILCIWLFSVSYSAGPGQLVGAALTTAPGESGSFCAQSGCHASNGSFDQTTLIELTDIMGDPVTEYTPSADYDVSVVISASSGSPGAYGFQMVALRDSDNTSTDSWASSLPNTVHAVRLLNRDYVEHDGPMTGSNRFTVRWTAPEKGTGDVTFYAAGNAVNLNGSPSGDDADTTSYSIKEAVSSATELLTEEFNLSVFPNPAYDILKIQIPYTQHGYLSLYSAKGKQWAGERIREERISWDISSLPAGLYILRYEHENLRKPLTKKIVLH